MLSRACFWDFTASHDMLRETIYPTSFMHERCLEVSTHHGSVFIEGVNASIIELDAISIERKGEFHGHSNAIQKIIELSSKHLLSASHDKTVRLWNRETRQAIGLFPTLDRCTALAVDTRVSRNEADCFVTVIAGDYSGHVYCLELENVA